MFIKKSIPAVLYLILLLSINDCAHTQELKKDKKFTQYINVVDNCVSVDETYIRHFLYETQTYWDAINAHINFRKRSKEISDKEMKAYLLLKRELTKYYTNTLMLFLNGDISSSFCNSLITVKVLILNTNILYPDIKANISHIINLREPCITVKTIKNGPIRTFLYEIKTNWDELSLRIFNMKPDNYETYYTLIEFIFINKEFIRAYTDVLLLYFKEDVASDEFLIKINKIKELLQKASNKFAF